MGDDKEKRKKRKRITGVIRRKERDGGWDSPRDCGVWEGTPSFAKKKHLKAFLISPSYISYIQKQYVCIDNAIHKAIQCNP